MTRTFTKDDLDRLLDLVGQAPVLGASAQPFLTEASAAARALWSANERHWERELRAATEDAWSDQQYQDAARLICTAEHQQMVFKQFADALNDIAPGSWEPRLVWSRPEFPSPEALSSDQIVFVPAHAADDSVDEFDDAQVHDIEIARAANGSSALPLYAPANGAHVVEGNIVGAAGLADEDRGVARPVFNAVRANLFLQTGLALAKPYDGWADFKARNDLPDDVVLELKAAYPDGFHKLDLWIGALVESSYQANVDATVEALLARHTSQIALDYNYDALQLLMGTRIADSIDQGRLSDLLPKLRASGPHDPVEDSELHDALDALEPIIVGTDGDDVLFGTDGDDVMLGGAGNDRMFGGAGDDLLLGGDGDDLLDGGAGDDVLHGGAGDDLLLGGDGDDILDGGAGDDVLHGGGGQDVLIGGAGDDILEGGAGDDLLYGDSIDASENDPTVESIVAIGSSKDDVIAGSAGDDLIDGGGGRDTLIGGAGNDSLFGGRGNDTLIGGDGDDILDGGRDKDTMIGGAGNDLYIVDNAGDVVIELVDEGRDTIETTLSSYALPDNVEILVYTGNSNFSGRGNASDNVIVGGSGNDVLMGCEGDDILMGGAGDDVLLGGDGNDTLIGGSGRNRLDGGDGDDVIYSGTGDDYIIFTRGNDTIVLMPGFGNDVLEGFNVDSSGSGSRHRIDVSAYDFDSDALGRDILLIYTDEGTTVQIGNDSLLLLKVDVNEIEKGHFIF